MASKRNVKAAPQVEATVFMGITAKIMRFTARQDFAVGNSRITKGETCFAVASDRRPGRYYIVHFSTERNLYQCSCGANCSEHAHLKVVREFVLTHVVRPAKSATSKQDEQSTKQASSVQVVIPTVPLTTAQWKEIRKASKARDEAFYADYRARAAAALAQTKLEIEQEEALAKAGR